MTRIKLAPWEKQAIKEGAEIAKSCFPPLKVKDIARCSCCNAPRDEWDYCDLCGGVGAYEVRNETPYVPSWCYEHGPKMCPCGHHEGYHNDKGDCLLSDKCQCTGLARE